MMLKKLPLNPTKQEVQRHNKYVTYCELKKKIKSDCEKSIRAVEFKLSYFKENKITELPCVELSLTETIECYS